MRILLVVFFVVLSLPLLTGCESVSDAGEFMGLGPDVDPEVVRVLHSKLTSKGATAVIGATPVVPTLLEKFGRATSRGETALTIAARAAALLALAVVFALSCFSMAAGTYNPFIYFRF